MQQNISGIKIRKSWGSWAFPWNSLVWFIVVTVELIIDLIFGVIFSIIDFLVNWFWWHLLEYSLPMYTIVFSIPSSFLYHVQFIILPSFWDFLLMIIPLSLLLLLFSAFVLDLVSHCPLWCQFFLHQGLQFVINSATFALEQLIMLTLNQGKI